MQRLRTDEWVVLQSLREGAVERVASGRLQHQSFRLPPVARYTDGMRIPYNQLSPTALRAVVEEFVTRDGTDHSLVEQRIADVIRQLDAGSVELQFNAKTGTCNILPCGEHSAANGGDA